MGVKRLAARRCRWRTVGARGGRRKLFAQLVLALFVAPQNFPGALDDAARQAREARHFDAVALVGAAFLDAPQKDDFVGRFLDGDVDIFHAGQQVGQFGELVIVRGEQGARARLRLQMLDHRPGDGEAVEGGRAAADFVEQHQAVRRREIQDGGDFAHLHQKRGAAAREIVGSADAREDAVGERQARLFGGDERAHLRQQHDQRGLAQIGGLAAHVGPGDQQNLMRGAVQVERVGHEALALLFEQLLDHRMAAAEDEAARR